jgi:hypothetical protein
VDARHKAGHDGKRKAVQHDRPRPEYHGSYYAAFIRDPDGNRIEAVTFVTAK